MAGVRSRLRVVPRPAPAAQGRGGVGRLLWLEFMRALHPGPADGGDLDGSGPPGFRRQGRAAALHPNRGAAVLPLPRCRSGFGCDSNTCATRDA